MIQFGFDIENKKKGEKNEEINYRIIKFSMCINFSGM